MSLMLDYDQDNARVEITVDGLQTAGAVLFTIERSTDQVNWTRVRGAINQPVIDDDPILFFDYEYTPGPGVTNFYRVVGQDAAEFVGVGAATHVNQAGSLGVQTFTLPAGIQEGDLLIAWIAARRTAIVGDGVVGQAPFSPSWQSLGWSFAHVNVISRSDPAGPGSQICASFMKIAGPSESNPQVVVAGSPVSCQIAAFRNVQAEFLNARVNAGADNSNAQNISVEPLSIPDDHALVMAFGVKQDDWTSVTPPSGFTEIDESSTTLGEDQGLTWSYQIQTQAQNIPAGQFTVTGGSTANSVGLISAFPYDPGASSSTVLFSDSVATPLEVAWLKNPLRPPRNTIVKLGRPTQLRRAARSGLFDIKGRADPIEVTEIRRSIAWVQPFVADSFGESDGLLDLFEPGETLLLHVPGRDDSPGCPPSQDLPGGYIHVGEVVEERSPDKSLPRAFTAPVQKVAGPRPELNYIEPPESSS